MPIQDLKYDEHGAIIVPMKTETIKVKATNHRGEVYEHVVEYSIPDADAMQPKPTAKDIALAPYKRKVRHLLQQGKIEGIKEFTRTRFRDPVDVVFEEDPELPPESDLEEYPENPFGCGDEWPSSKGPQ